MRAIFNDGEFRNAKYLDKETVQTIEVMVRTRSGMENPVSVKVQMGRSRNASKVYASIWISGREVSRSGAGSAGGYGYCKTSAAICDALGSAGVQLVSTKSNTYPDRPTRKRGERLHFGGCGMQAVRDALSAIVRSMGYRGEIMILGC